MNAQQLRDLAYAIDTLTSLRLTQGLDVLYSTNTVAIGDSVVVLAWDSTREEYALVGDDA